MPEGHTLHRLADEITRRLGGSIVTSTSPQGRFAAGAGLVDGHVVAGAQAWGKHLLIDIDQLSETVHVHLGLYGSWRWIDHDPFDDPPVVGQVRWRLRAVGDAAAVTADLRGPAACELWLPDEVSALRERLGPDPLRADADPDRAWERLTRSRTPVATLLMDQSVVAGVGNVYRAEALFRAGLDPWLPGRELAPEQWADLWDDLVTLMREGVRLGRIDTVRPEHEPAAMGRDPREDDHGGEVYVYRRDGRPCHVCGTAVRTTVLAARNLFWCPTCQNSPGPPAAAGTVSG